MCIRSNLRKIYRLEIKYEEVCDLLMMGADTAMRTKRVNPKGSKNKRVQKYYKFDWVLFFFFMVLFYRC